MSDQGATYAAFIEGELEAERNRRATLNARGIGVVTTSGTLVTLLAAVAAFVSSSKTYVVPAAVVIPLILALVALSVAAALGIIANRAVEHDAASVETLWRMRTDHWTDNEINARNQVAALNITTIESLRAGSNRKAKWLTGALTAQLFALVMLSVVVYIVIAAR